MEVAGPSGGKRRGAFGGMLVEREGPLSPDTALCPAPGSPGRRAILVKPAKGEPGLGNGPSEQCHCDHLRKAMLTHGYRCQ